MGFVKPTVPDVDYEEFLRMPLMERIRIMCLKWVDQGYGAPRMIHVLYIVKLVFFYAIGVVAIATATSHLPAFWHVSEWWNQPIVYQKAVLWTILLELLGMAGSWGPLAGKTTWAGTSDRSRLLSGVDLRVRVVSPRKRIDGSVALRASAIGG